MLVVLGFAPIPHEPLDAIQDLVLISVELPDDGVLEMAHQTQTPERFVHAYQEALRYGRRKITPDPVLRGLGQPDGTARQDELRQLSSRELDLGPVCLAALAGFSLIRVEADHGMSELSDRARALLEGMLLERSLHLRFLGFVQRDGG